jgi:hypothetical protein
LYGRPPFDPIEEERRALRKRAMTLSKSLQKLRLNGLKYMDYGTEKADWESYEAKVSQVVSLETTMLNY